MTQILPLSDVVSELTKLLSTEKQLLLEGQYEKVHAFNTKKTNLTAALTQHFQMSSRENLILHKDNIESILRLSEENARLLKSAKSGVSSAISRITSLVERENTVGTYQLDGHKLQTHNAGVTQDKIA